MKKIKHFSSTGAVQSWAIPACVSTVRAECWGAAGGDVAQPISGAPYLFAEIIYDPDGDYTPWRSGNTFTNYAAAFGSNLSGYAAADLWVPRSTAGVPAASNLYVAVGSNGANAVERLTNGAALGGAGGWPDGGDGGEGWRNSTTYNASGGAGGGGSTSVLAASSFASGNVLVIAAGAGGNGVRPYDGQDRHEVELPLSPTPPYQPGLGPGIGRPLVYFDCAELVGGGGTPSAPGGPVYSNDSANAISISPVALGSTATTPGTGGVSPAGSTYNGSDGSSVQGGAGGGSTSASASGLSRWGGGGGGGGIYGGGGGAATVAATINATDPNSGNGGGGGGGASYITTSAVGAWLDAPMNGVIYDQALPPTSTLDDWGDPCGDGTGGACRFTYRVHPSTPSALSITGGTTHGDQDPITVSFTYNHSVPFTRIGAYEFWVSADGGVTFTKYTRYTPTGTTTPGSTHSQTLPAGTFAPGTYILAVNTADDEGDDNLGSRLGAGYGGWATTTLTIVAAPTKPVVSLTSVTPSGSNQVVAFSWTSPSGTPTASITELRMANGTLVANEAAHTTPTNSTTLNWPNAAGSADDALARVQYKFNATAGYSDFGEKVVEINIAPPTATGAVTLNKNSAAGTNTISVVRTGGTDVNKFSVYRSADSGATWVRLVKLADMASGTGTFTDHTVSTDTAYTYKVRVYGTGYGTGSGSDGWKEITTGTVVGS
jgi:hypothetical protein